MRKGKYTLARKDVQEHAAVLLQHYLNLRDQSRKCTLGIRSTSEGPGMSRTRQRILRLLLVGGTAIAVVLGMYFFSSRQHIDSPPSLIVARSDDLRHTAIVPTLDTPIPENKSAIWCSSFALAWNRLKSDVVKEAIHLKNAEAVADRLNRAEQSDRDLDEHDLYTAAGLVKDGIIKRIQREMVERFPDLPPPELDAPADGAVAYGFLRAHVKFNTPFFENEQKFQFTEANGKPVSVKSFGIRDKDPVGLSTTSKRSRWTSSIHERQLGPKCGSTSSSLTRASTHSRIRSSWLALRESRHWPRRLRMFTKRSPKCQPMPMSGTVRKFGAESDSLADPVDALAESVIDSGSWREPTSRV